MVMGVDLRGADSDKRQLTILGDRYVDVRHHVLAGNRSLLVT